LCRPRPIRTLRLTEMTPHLLAQFVTWLCLQTTPDRKLPDGGVKPGQMLSDSTVRNAINPVRACLATAVAEGLLRSNPANGLRLPRRPPMEEEVYEEVRALSREQLRDFLVIVHPRYRLMFRFLAVTGSGFRRRSRFSGST
jgi:integrase